MTGRPLEEDRFIRDEERHYDLEAVAVEYAKRPEFLGFFELIADDFVTMEELERFAMQLPPVQKFTELEWADSLVERIRQVRERENRPIYPRSYWHCCRDNRTDR